jgi:hypothetical protein
MTAREDHAQQIPRGAFAKTLAARASRGRVAKLGSTRGLLSPHKKMRAALVTAMKIPVFGHNLQENHEIRMRNISIFLRFRGF